MAKKPSSQTGDLLSQKPLHAVAGAEGSKPLSTFNPSAPAGTIPGKNGAPFPKVLEYSPLGSPEKWRVEKFEDLAAEFELDPSLMVHFHELGLRRTRQWLFCRRLFGIGPMIPPADASPDDLHPWSRAELCASQGIEPAQLQQDLDGLRALWRDRLKSEERAEVPLAKPVDEKPREELSFGDDVLREFGFDEKMFNVRTKDPDNGQECMRPVEESRIEKEWFCKRVHEWRRMLSEPMAGGLAREALQNELYLRRFGAVMMSMDMSNSKWKTLFESKKQMEQIFKEQLEQLQTMFPDAAIAGRETTRMVISSFIKAHTEWYARANRRLIDQVFTATEIEVQVRQSQQAREPKYRFGLSVAITEAIHNLQNPDFRPAFKHSTLKKLDQGMKEAIARVSEELNETLVNLEDGVLPGEGSNYEDLKEDKV